MAPIRLDGRTGEGGGQLVRMAVALASLTSQPISITNIRGNRPSGGGKRLYSRLHSQSLLELMPFRP